MVLVCRGRLSAGELEELKGVKADSAVAAQGGGWPQRLCGEGGGAGRGEAGARKSGGIEMPSGTLSPSPPHNPPSARRYAIVGDFRLFTPVFPSVARRARHNPGRGWITLVARGTGVKSLKNDR